MNWRQNWWKYAFFVFALAFIHFDFFRGFDFSPIDDHGLVDTIIVGKPLRWLIGPEVGRFLPFTPVEYNVLIPFHATSPNAFHLVNFIELCLFCFVLYWALQYRWKHFLAALFFIYFTNGFQESYTHSGLPEKAGIIFLTAFFAFYLMERRSPKQDWLMIGAATLGIYFKETNFILVSVPICIELLVKWKRPDFSRRVDFFILGQCALYLFIYWYFIRRYTVQTYNSELGDTTGRLSKLIKFGFSDLYFVLIPLFIALKFSWRKIKEMAVLSGLFLFLMAFIVLNLQSPHYMTAASTGLILVFFNLEIRRWEKIGLLLIYICFYFGDGLGAFFYWRQMPRSMASTIQKLGETKPERIMVVDIDEKQNGEWILGFSKFYTLANHVPVNIIFGHSETPRIPGVPRVLFPVHDRSHESDVVSDGPAYVPSISVRTLVKYWLVHHGNGQVKNYDVFQNPNFYILD